MGDNLTYLFIAFFVTWLAIGGYLWSLGRQVKSLRDEVNALASEESLLPYDEASSPSSIETAEPRTQAGPTQA